MIGPREVVPRRKPVAQRVAGSVAHNARTYELEVDKIAEEENENVCWQSDNCAVGGDCSEVVCV